MNLTGKPIPLPLDPSINRCLGHGHNKGEWCDRLATCAAHQTISHDAQVFAPAAYRKCMTDNMAAYLPIDGFQAEEEAAAPVQIAPANDSGQTIKVGEICTRLGFTVTADFLATLGIHPSATDKNAKLYPASKFPTICRLISEHVMALAFKKAA